MRSQDVQEVRDSYLFQGLDEAEFARLAEYFELKKVAEGKTVFVENMPGESLYLVRSGAIQLSKLLAEGDEKTVVVLSPPEVFGELALLEDSQRSATAKVAEEATLLMLKKSAFQALCERDPGLGFKVLRNIMQVFAERIRQSNEEYREMLKWALKQGRSE